MLSATIAAWGLPAVFVGAGIEGEASVICGGVLAQRGAFPLAFVIGAATLGSFTSDQFFFLMGRYFSHSPRVQSLTNRRPARKALRLVERHPAGFILAFRFLYGFRLISPIAIGTTRISHRLFMLLNAIAALVWASIFSTIGYAFGDSADRISLSWPFDVDSSMIMGAVAIGFALVGWWFFRRIKSGDRSSRPPALGQGTA